jgi:hypothetical protein
MWIDMSRKYLNLFSNQQTEEERQCGYFQQDGATSHTANNSMRVLQEVFNDRIIITGLWPLRPPILAFVIFICGATLKGKCTGTTLALLKQ